MTPGRSIITSITPYIRVQCVASCLHIWEVPDSNFGLETRYPEWGFLYFCWFHSCNCQLVPEIRPWPLHSTTFQINYLWTMLPIDHIVSVAECNIIERVE